MDAPHPMAIFAAALFLCVLLFMILRYPKPSIAVLLIWSLVCCLISIQLFRIEAEIFGPMYEDIEDVGGMFAGWLVTMFLCSLRYFHVPTDFQNE